VWLSAKNRLKAELRTKNRRIALSPTLRSIGTFFPIGFPFLRFFSISGIIPVDAERRL
jgi:hypothetical protein